MSVPKATVTELDGQLGVVPLRAGLIEAIVGDSEAGPLDTPAVFSRLASVISTFTGGPLVERSCYALEQSGGPGYIVCVRSDRTTDGAAGSVDDHDATGTSVVSVDVDPVAPWDAYEVEVVVVLGGTIGTGPITLKYSLDGGRNYSRNVSLGTANTYTIPNSGVVLAFAAGTLVTGEFYTFTTSAPKWNAAQLATSLAAILTSTQPIEYTHVAGACSGTEKDTIIAAANASHSAGKHRWFTCEARMPNAGESDSTYQASVIADFASHKNTSVEVTAGACRVRSSVTGRVAVWNLRMPVGVVIAPMYAAVEPHIDIARTDRGPIPGCQIKDENGNPEEHDEFETPGLDDAGFTTLRTFAGSSDVYVNNPRIQSADGSDFMFVQYRRVMNILRTALQAYLRKRLSIEVRVQTKGADRGHILESEAKEIEAGANRALWLASKEGRYLSGDETDPRFVLSRDDDILATQTLTYDARAVPLGYVKEITGALGFSNPARAIAA